jgi:carboxypeptidase C (cathepsin A)
MKIRSSAVTLALTLALGLPFATLAQPPAAKSGDAKAREDGGKGKEAAKEPEDKVVVTQHASRIAGAELRYTATTGTLVMRDEDGKAKATIFFVAYSKDGEDAGKRPITFAFNGGPGSSSVWLHLGAFGPRRVLANDDGSTPPPPYTLVDNDESLLALSDLVFIDPVTTGFSRAVPVDQDEPFHGVRADIESVGDFIRLYTSRYNRWASPKFLAGESYGTTRAAGLSGYLQRRHGMYLNGIVLLSAVLDFTTGDFNAGNDLPYALFLPTYTATAWYHKKLPADLQGDLQKALRESEAFARGEYAHALWLGDKLSESERTHALDELTRLTGLDRDELALARLRVADDWFFGELLHKQGFRVGRLDSRFRAPQQGEGGGTLDSDPSYDNILGPYTANLNAYLRGELGFASDLPYEILTGRVRPWSYKGYENRYLNVAETLAQAMHQNPALKVFVGNGYYDVATPYFATAYTFDHMGLTPEQKQNVSMGFYEAGHMMYIHRASMVKLRQDLGEFYRSALQAR